MTETTPNNSVFNLLIVDDEPDIHAAIKISLQHERVLDCPLNFLSAYSKSEASELIRNFEGQISVVFLDIMMETDSAGFDFLTELRNTAQPPQPQVIVVTGQAALSSERDVAKEYEINGYLSKAELNPNRLISVLNTSIRNFVNIQRLELTTKQLLLARVQQEESSAYTHSILNSISDALIVVNHKGVIMTTNASVNEVFGYTRDELVGQKVEILMPEPFASRHDRYMNSNPSSNEQSIIGKGRELPAKKKNGQTFPMELTLTEFNNQGETLYIGLIRNISDRIEAQKEIYHLAYFDPVTNLPNLTHFFKSLTSQQESLMPKDLISLGLVDLSGFYRINQAYGHDVGDQVLTLLVDRMEWILPKHCKLYRSEGTNFLIELNTSGKNKEEILIEFKAITKELLEAISQDIILGTSNHQISANIGLLIRPVDNIFQSKVLHQLEFATLQAKKVANEHFSIYDSAAEQKDTNKYLMEQELSKAIDRNEFSIYLQPQFNCNRNLVCSEALLRWNSSSMGFIPPDKFIHIAEDSGLIVPIGRWILDQVCNLIAATRNKGHKTNIAINVSAREILQPDFVDVVTKCINKYEIPPEAITLEVTESVFATDIESVIRSMTDLSEFGVRFSIDDFGTGYSSLSYLKRLPINELKIDKSFIDDVNYTSSSVPLVDAIITMANSLGLDIVAEGVEHEFQLSYLAKQSNMIIQGYLLSRPLPVSQWYDFINSKTACQSPQ